MGCSAHKPLKRERAFDLATEDTMTASVPGRYASALFELASEQRQIADVEKNLVSFQSFMDSSQDLQRLVRSPVFSADEQLKAITSIIEKAGIGGLAGNFLRLIARNRRLFAVPDMIRTFRALSARARGEVLAEVTSAIALTPAQQQALKDTLRGSAGKEVQLNTRVDPAILGGLVVKIGSRMIDSSFRTKLNTLKARMKEVR